MGILEGFIVRIINLSLRRNKEGGYLNVLS